MMQLNLRNFYLYPVRQNASPESKSDMNKNIETTNGSGSFDSLAQQLKAVTGTWPPSPELLEKHKAEKANLQFQSERYYWERRERKMAGLKERGRKVIQRNRDGLV